MSKLIPPPHLREILPFRARRARALPAVTKQHADLLNEQCWCWGRDILVPGRNLLIAYGFRRHARPARDGLPADQAYVLRWKEGADACQLVLWAYGFFFGRREQGGVFVGRRGFSVLLSLRGIIADPFVFHSMPGLLAPASSAQERIRAARLLAEGVEQVARYERWVRRHVGAAYRWRSHRVRPVPRLLQGWTALARALEEVR